MASSLPTILYVGGVRAQPTVGGSIVLYRHLHYARNRFAVEELSPPSSVLDFWGVCRRTASITASFGGRTIAEEAHALIDGRWADRWLKDQLMARQDAVVVTVAHGDVVFSVARAARAARLPLVVVFHDWWPAIPALSSVARRRVSRKFIQLHQQSAVSLPVSDGMRSALGPHPAARVLYPIPDEDDRQGHLPNRRGQRYLRVLYAGNLWEYGAMMRDALLASLGRHNNLRLEVRGGDPWWSEQFRNEMKSRELWFDFAPRRELQDWLESADAFLIPMTFDPSLRRRMETSFPSKLTEFSRYGKPLVVWGPDYSAIISWAKKTGCAVAVTSSNTADLLDALERLAADASRRDEMGHRARHAYETQFSPSLTQSIFEESILLAAETGKHHGY